MEKGDGEEKVCTVEFLSVVARRDDFGETGRETRGQEAAAALIWILGEKEKRCLGCSDGLG